MRYAAGINHEARGRAAPEGRVIFPETYRTTDVTCCHEPIAMVNGAKFLVLSP